MKNLLTIIFFFITITVFAQTTHDITVTNFSFTPAELTIVVGDVVRWTNVLGTHNVKADDNSFTNGPAAPAPWEFTHTFTAAGNNPYYCEPHGGPGGNGMSGVIIVQNPSGVGDEDLVAEQFHLEQNYPNPFNPTTTIKYSIPNSNDVNLKVYNILGGEVSTLVSEYKTAGTYTIEFNAGQYVSGLYFYQLQSGDFIETKKMSLMK